MSTDVSTCKYSRILRLNCPYQHIRILRFQRFADTGDGTACSDSGAETVDFLGSLFKHFKRRVVLVSVDIINIRKLLRYKDVLILFSHFQCCIKALLNTSADIAVIMNQDNFCAVVLNEFTAFFTY